MPVPFWTTLIIIWVTAAATCGVVAVIHGLGLIRFMSLPLASWISLATWGVMITPPFAMPVGDERHLQRGHRNDALADPGERELGHVLRERAGRRAGAGHGARGIVERRRGADPELGHAGHELLAELEAELPEGGVA